jgi:peptide/nickel transport system substrate-binding protein
MYAIDWDSLNEAALNGEAIQLASHVLPTSWAYDPELATYDYDPEKAAELLTEAGWIDDDNDASTPRVAQGAMYAEDGTSLAFVLKANTGNDSSETIGTLLKEQWGAVGFNVDFQMIDFNILLDEFVGQTYDATMLFWGFSFPDSPDDASANFAPQNDVPGSGFNVSSYNNPRVTEILEEANSVPDCDQETRAALYKEMFQILRDDVPWIWLDTTTLVVGAQAGVENWDPKPQLVPLAVSWNQDAWIIPR